MVAKMSSVASQMDNIHYLIQRLKTIQNRMQYQKQDTELIRIIGDATYALGTMAVTMQFMEAEHEKMKLVLRWIVKGDLEEHLDEVRAFIDAG
jgi:hypothetical protein